MSAGPQAAILQAWYCGSRWLWLLRPFEGLFRSLSWLRRRAYRYGLLAVFHADKPVVVVGNITVGGTGKTPVVVALVEALQARGFKPGVISRGYGATSGSFPYLVTAESTVAACGDEALMLVLRTGCACAVAPSRKAAVQWLLAHAKVDIIISDDGLQHYGLARDLEIAVFDAGRRTGNGFCLPAGPLREPISRLASVDWLLYRGSDDPREGVLYRAVALVNLLSGESREVIPTALAAGVHAVAGIGQPAQFFGSLRDAGFEITPHAFPDHHNFTVADFATMSDKPIIMSEKDAVKCRKLAGDSMWYVQIEACLPERLIQQVLKLTQKGN